MVINSKNKGSNFERDVVKLLNEKIKGSTFKRTYASGAVGTYTGTSILTGDINGVIPGHPTALKLECKVGYSNKKEGAAKSLSVQKEWLDKIAMEARAVYAVPIVVAKFDGVREGVRHIVIMDLDVFTNYMNMISDLQHELDLVYKDKQKEEK